jgi:hypothetical protein
VPCFLRTVVLTKVNAQVNVYINIVNYKTTFIRTGKFKS